MKTFYCSSLVGTASEIDPPSVVKQWMMGHGEERRGSDDRRQDKQKKKYLDLTTRWSPNSVMFPSLAGRRGDGESQDMPALERG